ncbi:MAG: type III-A CRISPR-associated protein Cas10/Csm1 [Anaerolineae bacterium]|nr:type III-A CRISPR-associated protein Cas10/Csm1 [Anaerolineae bacterium]
MEEYGKQVSLTTLQALQETTSTTAHCLWQGEPLPLVAPADTRQVQLIQLAARWVAAAQEPLLSDASDSLLPLTPVLSRVALTETVPQENWKLAPAPLSLETLLPRSDVIATRQDYVGLWQTLCSAISNSGIALTAMYSSTWLALLRQYLSLVPSPIGADISLYEYARLTAALAVCLERGLTQAEQDILLRGEAASATQPVALMVRGDLSGIQAFIYRVTRPATDATFRGVAKRLRGRSFYLALLGDILTDWLIRELALSPANILFCGGGRFDLLIPYDSESLHILNACLETIEDWLLGTFHGELGVQFVTRLLIPADFADIRVAYTGLDYDLGRAKSHKWRRWLQDEAFHTSRERDYHACAVCNLSAVNDSGGICDLCEQQRKIGGKLPATTWLAFVYGTVPLPKGAVEVRFDCFGTRVWLLDDKEALKSLAGWPGESVKALFYRLNDTDFLPATRPPGVNFSFRFLANTAPVALRKIETSVDQEATQAGDVLDFDQIAALSTGAQRLGVLKADVDHLGLIFGEGLRPLTLARQATLSAAIEGFFAGRLNSICERVSQAWRSGLGVEHPHRNDASNLFYTLYAGGDDLFIVGPWDQTITLAEHLQSAFAAYVCHNANVTLSAGVVQVKPHYPAQRFAGLVSERLEEAKVSGRKRISVFDHIVEWQPDRGPHFDTLLDFAYRLTDDVTTERLPRSFIHYLGRLYREHFMEKDTRLKIPDPMYLPKLHYYLVRRWAGEDMDMALDIIQQLWQEKMMAHAPILVSYVSLITRKE